MNSAKILHRTETRLSPWVQVVTKQVEFAPGQPPEVYHCLSQQDYVAIFARTRSGLIPVVRQYRPAVEAYTWELPSGLLEPGEDPEEACRRELQEETGLRAESVTSLGCSYPDTGRLENRLHAFYVLASDPDPQFLPEHGLFVDFVTMEGLRRRILSGEFCHELHLGVLTLATVRGFKLD